MRIHLSVLLSFGFFVSMAQQSLKSWDTQPGMKWVEALPLGNGKIGAMVFGGMEQELIQLNESTLWSSGPVKSNVNPEAPEYLTQVREALLKKKDYDTADKLTRKIQGMYPQSYLPFGDLVIKPDFKGAKASAYYRDLNIDNAVATTKLSKITCNIFSRL